MQQLIAGIIIGAAAIFVGPKLISGVTGALRPMGKGILNFGEDALGTITNSVSTTGNWVSDWFGFTSDTVHPPPATPTPAPGSEKTGQAAPQAPPTESESDQKEESFLEEAEEFGKEVAVRLVEEEAISFIKLAILAIV